MRVVLTMPDPPPYRQNPGLAADRSSPGAGALVSAGNALMASQPHVFPLEWDEIFITFGRSKPEVDGYDATHPIIEILVDIGVLAEQDSWATREARDTTSGYYVVVVEARHG